MANARIDAIIYALVQESLRSGGWEGGCGRGSDGEEEEEEVAADEGTRSTKRRDAGGHAASYALSNNDVEAVITYVDRDDSGEIDVEVGGWTG